MKRVILFGLFVALLCGCNNASTQTPQPNDILADSLANATTVRYLDAMPADFNVDDIFGLILDYGGYEMIVEAWQMPDGDWLIPYHWSEMEDGGYYEEDEAGNQTEIEYKDPFEGQPYPVIHNPHFSFATRNYGGDTIIFYKAPDSQEIICTTNYPEISLDVVAVDTKTRRLLVQSNPKDWCWGEVEEEWQEGFRHPFVDLRGWVDEEWVCANTVTTCP